MIPGCGFAVVFLLSFLTLALPAYSQSGSQPCAAVTPKNKQEALKMEASSDKNGCWVRDKNGNLTFVSNGTPNTNYKPLLSEPAQRPRRPKQDPIAGLTGHGELAGEWRVHVANYYDIDNGGNQIFCRGESAPDNSSANGMVIVGWDHVPHWTCDGYCDVRPFNGIGPGEDVHSLIQTEPGTYVGEHSYPPAKKDFSVRQSDPPKMRLVIEKDFYKIVVTGNTFAGIHTETQDQSAANGHSEVVCEQQVFNGERVIPKAP